jgi:hypothetical protein
MNKLYVLLFGFAFFLPQPAMGCTIPVFRYALEKWELTPYEILVYHRGALPADLQKTLDKWNATPSKANVDITFIDLDAKQSTKLRDSQIDLWKAEASSETTPWMLVRYQVPRQQAFTAWSGPCTLANVDRLLDSPMRQAILAHLTRGASGVFVLVTSGDEKKDKAAHDLVLKQLQTLEKRIKLEPVSKDGPQLRLPLPLKVWLPVLVLDRQKVEEAVLVRLLLNTGPEFAETKDPILLSIFGKGRVLPGITGEDLNEKVLIQVAEFLCGPCSCEVKDVAGIDLLLAADWKDIADKLFEGKEAMPMPAGSFTMAPNTSKTAEMLAAPVAPKTLAPSPIIETPSSPVMTEVVIERTPSHCVICRNWLWIATGIAGVLVLATGVWACWSLRK